ncbi:helicase, putative [Trichomonas vaginalis G3]|uniref:Helicase, putative n=1 Tax=Trichomonas vaginalis (strain ATCC PRA-98 / G3) TaxID=412133 RepID=A2DSC5_TRIV3|nr:DNA repair DEAD helicase RAD3/XP-D subfamily member family [Trichomonas vaginalis G3]EAY16704.1 helicase, putative [Trichomonas vaginalis G3]KAI5543130.1 DNA repair DEAD helicase RAD3/XP-D subfamily member family [Trichomonas vaginalis G3]|eukprot:XP_001328927.1 helicase [Trichomonas vaginalis G3]
MNGPKPAHQFKVAGIEVPFPHEKPYAAQMALMAGVIKSMRTGQNAILESPTGTGKSIALLSAALAFQKSQKEVNITPPGQIDPPITKSYLGFFPPMKLVHTDQEIFSPLLTQGLNPSEIPRYSEFEGTEGPTDYTTDFYVKRKQHAGQIWYATRTHQQLKQLVKEMKKLPFHPQMVIMASRAQVCVNPKIMNQSDVDGHCSDLQKNGGCPYDKKKGIPKEFKPNGILDKFEIEDLKDWCRKNKGCPYFISRKMMMAADIVFCPYNYFLDPKIKGQMQLDLTGVYLIIDEAHNIENSCRDGGSFHQSRKDLEWALMYLRKSIKKSDIPSLRKAFMIVLELITKEYEWFTSTTKYLRLQGQKEFIVRDNKAFYDSLRLNLSFYTKLVAAFDCIFKFCNTMNFPQIYQEADKIPMILGGILEQQWVAIALTLKYDLRNYAFAIVLGDDESNDIFHGLCMNPGAVFHRPGTEASNVILSSGTLTPLEEFENEFGVPFPIRLSAPHVISPDQVVGFTITSCDNVTLSSRHQYLESQGMRNDVNLKLAEILLHILPVIPNGVLFFVTSHSFLMRMLDAWQKAGLYEKIDKIKKIFYETPDSDPEFFDKYKASCEEGSLLIGVFRGRSSEGIDFVDEQARAVIVFGIPFPSYYDIDVKLKKEYNDYKNQTGNVWYDTQAYRSLFQALGRCIRHKNDFGSVILIDQRYPNELHRFPKWLKTQIRNDVGLNQIVTELSRFYQRMKEKFPRKISLKMNEKLTFYCCDCHSLVVDCKKVKDGQSFQITKNGFLSLSDAEQKEHYLIIQKNDIEEMKLNFFSPVFKEEDKLVYEKCFCDCGNCLGVRVYAASSVERSSIGSLFLLLSRLNVKVGNNFVGIQPTEKKVSKNVFNAYF